MGFRDRLKERKKAFKSRFQREKEAREAKKK